MMVDYSDWLNSLPREFHLNTGWFLVIPGNPFKQDNNVAEQTVNSRRNRIPVCPPATR